MAGGRRARMNDLLANYVRIETKGLKITISADDEILRSFPYYSNSPEVLGPQAAKAAAGNDLFRRLHPYSGDSQNLFVGSRINIYGKQGGIP